MKHLKLIFITLTILLSLSNFAFAQTTNIKEICPGDKPTLSWQVVTGTATNCPVQAASAGACQFTARQDTNFTGQRIVDLPSGSCSVQFQCQGSGGSSNVSTAYLRVKTLGQCQIEGHATARCPAGQVPDIFNTYQVEVDNPAGGNEGEPTSYMQTIPGVNHGTGCITPTATVVGGSCTISLGQSSCTAQVSFIRLLKY